MLKHIVIWRLKDGIDKKEASSRIKHDLENLRDKVPGIIDLKVMSDPLPSGNADIMLYSVFTDDETFRTYQKDPRHVEIGKYVKEVVSERSCFDYFD